MADFDDFKARYPELVSPADGNQTLIEFFLAEALVVINVDACPRYADQIQMAYAAHMISRSSSNPGGQSSGAGPETSKSVGGVSVSYQVSESNGVIEDFYKSTPYGQDLIRLKKMCFAASVRIVP